MTFYLIFSFICFLLSTAYLLIVNINLLNWRQLPSWEIPENYSPKTKFTIIVPVRNEAAHIERCLKSILDQNYPKELFEIIVVNDHSTDDTLSIINALNADQISVINLSEYELDENFNSFKKFGIQKGIEKADGQMLLHTDGDCVVQKNWIAYFASHFEEHQQSFVAGPVNFHAGKNGIQNFQELDFMGMMLLTGAAVQRKKGHMCNGANLAYTKALFESVGGFQNINELASGDDILLMHKIAENHAGEIAFLKNHKATVFTQPAQTWSDFNQQRIRWATKSNTYEDKSVLLTLIAVFLFHCFIVLSLMACILFGSSYLKLFVMMLFMKLIADFSLLRNATKFFNNKEAMWQFVPSFFIHIYYIVYIGIVSNLKKSYVWKGREVR